MAIQLQPEDLDPKRMNQAIREVVEGRHNAAARFTLAPGATTTVVTHPNCSKDCEPQFSPRTANAALAVATSPGVYVSAVNQGSFVLTHANSAQTDREFGYTVSGG